MLCNLTLVANWYETLDTLGQYAMGALERRRSVFESQLSGKYKDFIRISYATFLRSAISNSFGLHSLIEKVRISYATFLRSAISNSFGLHSLIEKVPFLSAARLRRIGHIR